MVNAAVNQTFSVVTSACQQSLAIRQYSAITTITYILATKYLVINN